MPQRKYREDRSPEARAFIETVIAVCDEHGFTIGHEDAYGGFLVERGTDHRWFSQAAEFAESDG